MHITIVTLFPQMFVGPFDSSIVARAITKKTVDISYINIRDFANDSYGTVDDHPYGGGPGMILRVDVLDRAIKAAKNKYPTEKTHTILLDPQGTPYTQQTAKKLSTISHLLLVCGHYEGIDERIRALVDEEISIGDYVLTGGELPAMVIVDSIVRLIPGVLKKSDATISESFNTNTLEYPQFTRPETYNGQTVPSILLSGNHADIMKWKDTEATERTKKRRPDLLK